MRRTLRGRTAIIGVGHDGYGEAPGHSAIEIMAGDQHARTLQQRIELDRQRIERLLLDLSHAFNI